MNGIDLEGLEVEALSLTNGDENIESLAVGQGVTETGASYSGTCCTIACCCGSEIE